jgi:hypothetical protein
MKRLLALIILAVFFLFGCSGVPINFGAPKLPATLCIEYDPGTSYILKVTEEREVPLNEVYYGLLDATQVAAGFKLIKREDLAKFMVKLGEWYDENYPMSLNALIKHMKNQEQAMALTGILTRRIGIFDSVQPIGLYDDCLLRAGWNDAMDELFLR